MAIGVSHFIGKESNKLEEVEEGGVPDVSDVYTEYPDRRRDEWTNTVLAVLRAVPLRELIRESGLSRRGQRDEAWFRREIAPKLDAFSLREIAVATGLSLAACSRIRAGARVPHPRHWGGLLALVEAGN